MHVQIEESWRLRLQEEFDKPYFERLVRFVKEKYARYSVFPPGSRIFMLIIPVRLRQCFPDPNDIFNAFEFTPLSEVKVVILGKIFTRSPDSIMGCIFPVMDEVPFLSSLVNIFR